MLKNIRCGTRYSINRHKSPKMISDKEQHYMILCAVCNLTANTSVNVRRKYDWHNCWALAFEASSPISLCVTQHTLIVFIVLHSPKIAVSLFHIAKCISKGTADWSWALFYSPASDKIRNDQCAHYGVERKTRSVGCRLPVWHTRELHIYIYVYI